MLTNDVLGVAFPEYGWVPAPRYLLRRALVMDFFSRQAPGALLEIGPGIGALLYELGLKGWQCTGVEESAPARELAGKALAGSSVRLLDTLPPEGEAFDCLMALEVLEHIEDDHATLRAWTKRLKPGGRLVLSVPCHQRKWSASDVLVGHYRRYERDTLAALVTGAGYEVDELLCYGWPLSSLTDWLRSLCAHYQLKRRKQDSMRAKTHDSGINRSLEKTLYPLYANPVSTLLLQLAIRMQGLVKRRDMGTGYLLVATKK